jgi:hypothetical protein
MGTISAQGILLLVLLLQLKHALSDGPFQTIWMIGEKGFYGKPGGLAHALVHGIGCIAALVLFGLPIGLAILLSLADGLAHYHIDYFKEVLVRRRGWTPRDKFFWWTLAADQIFHHVTYIAIAFAVVRWAG